MMTRREVRGLVHAMKDELNVRIGTVIKCAVMLMLVFGLLWIGSSSEPLATQASISAAAAMAPPKNESASRRLFEERRQRYIESNPDSHVAREGGERQRQNRNRESESNLRNAPAELGRQWRAEHAPRIY